MSADVVAELCRPAGKVAMIHECKIDCSAADKHRNFLPGDGSPSSSAPRGEVTRHVQLSSGVSPPQGLLTMQQGNLCKAEAMKLGEGEAEPTCSPFSTQLRLATIQGTHTDVAWRCMQSRASLQPLPKPRTCGNIEEQVRLRPTPLILTPCLLQL